MVGAYGLQRRFTAEDERALAAKLRRRSFSHGRFRLASGGESSHYFNVKATVMNPKGAHLVARAFLDRILDEKVDFVGGLELGAVPIIGALAAVSYGANEPIRTFFVRKSAKTHGAQLLVEGLSPEESLAGSSVMLIDDVTTTGSSLIKAADAVRALGADVRGALVLVDREEGATETLAKLGIPLHAVFRASQFL